jgi:hypothetical protein
VFDVVGGGQRRITDRDGAGGRWLWGLETAGQYALFNGAPTVFGSIPDTSFKVWGGEDTGSGKNLYTNGVIDASNSSGSGYLENGLTVGSNVAGNQNLDGALAELIMINGSISTADRQKIEGYLAWKWGLQGDLDAGHPYKNERPIISRKAVNL